MLSPGPIRPALLPPPSAFRGTLPFGDSEVDRELFCGRDEEADGLTLQILTSPLVVLFGQAGLGKTSLICAAVLHRLRAKGCFPIVVRLAYENRDEIGADPPAGLLQHDIARRIIAQIKDAAKDQNVVLEYDSGQNDLWSFFSTLSCRMTGKTLRPVLIIDQFEELFSRLAPAAKEVFVAQFADLAGNRVPAARRLDAERRLRKKRFKSKDEEERLVSLAYGEIGHSARLVISIRDDTLPKLDELKGRIPIIFRTTFRLLPMTPQQARNAITLPPQRIAKFGGNAFSFDEDAIQEILKFLRTRVEAGEEVTGEEIEPLQLQIVCQDLEVEHRRNGRVVISRADLGGRKGLGDIIKAYYKRVMRKVPAVHWGWNPRGWRPSWSNLLLLNFPRSAACFLCERVLITPLGQRNTLDTSTIERIYGVRQEYLHRLVNAYLLREEPRRQLTLYELSHDSLVNMLRSLGKRRTVIKYGLTLTIAFIVAGWLGLLVGERYKDQARNHEMARRSLNIKNDDKMSSQEKEHAIKWLLENTRPPSPSGLRPDFAGMPIGDLNLQQANGFGPDFRSAILIGTNLESAILPKASFSKATISGSAEKRTAMKEAVLWESRFDAAIITWADFTNADLAGATFVRAKLSDVNFSHADLRNASFDNAVIGKNVEFGGSSWWLAKGWAEEHRQLLKDSYPDSITEFRKSKAFQNDVKKRLKTIDDTAAKNDVGRHTEALNDYAWILATSGVDPADPERYARMALQALPTVAGMDQLESEAKIKYTKIKEQINDTLSLIYLLQGKLPEAKQIMEEMSPHSGQDKSQRDGEWHYRYALILVGIGERQQAKQMKEQSEQLEYEPTYELLLLKDHVATLDRIN